MKTVLVTGIAGYIGSAVSHQLIEAGYEVVGIDNLKYGTRDAVPKGAAFVTGDISMEIDRFRLSDAVSNVDAVVHLAAESLIPLSDTDPGLFYRANVKGGINLLNAMVKHGIKRIIFSSTSSVYGDSNVPKLDENQPTNPLSSYGDTKLAFERALHWYWKAHGVQSTIFRYFNVNGGTDYCWERPYHQSRIIPMAFKAANGEIPAFQLYGTDYPTPDGTCVRDYLHVADVAAAHLLALKVPPSEQKPEVFNLGLGHGYSNLEVLDTVSRVTSLPIHVENSSRRGGDPARLVCCPRKAKEMLRWKPAYETLESIIESAWEQYQAPQCLTKT